jgi:ubiquinone/menaquinone biosynthesis C-methylase UbiE
MSAATVPEQISVGKGSASQRMTDLATGFAPALMIHAATQNRIFEHMDRGVRTIPELAAVTQTSERALRYLLEGLVSFGIVWRQHDRFVITPDASEYLVPGKPGYVGRMGTLANHWIHLAEVIRTGKPVSAINRQETGAQHFRSLADTLYQTHATAADSLAVALAHQWPSALTGRPLKVLDVGAGSGVWSIAVARRMPQCHVTAVDWADVTTVTRHYVNLNSVADRFRIVEGDVMDANYGGGYDLALLGHILHSEGETRSRKLLRKLYNSMAPGGFIVIIEYVPREDRSGPTYPMMFAIHMLLMSDEGDTFTFGQISRWLGEAGFIRMSMSPLNEYSTSVITAFKPG